MYNCILLYVSVHTANSNYGKLISGGMQFLTLNQGYTKFNLLVRHNIKYDQIISLHNITLISETIT
jgi:hypothetical protein